MPNLSSEIRSELEREVALAQQAAALVRQEEETEQARSELESKVALAEQAAALLRHEEEMEQARSELAERERAVERAFEAVQAQRQRLIEVREEYEQRRCALTERARELEDERGDLRRRVAELEAQEAALEARRADLVEPASPGPAPPVLEADDYELLAEQMRGLELGRADLQRRATELEAREAALEAQGADPAEPASPGLALPVFSEADGELLAKWVRELEQGRTELRRRAAELEEREAALEARGGDLIEPLSSRPVPLLDSQQDDGEWWDKILGHPLEAA